MSKGYYPFLDGLRAYAVAWVLLAHLGIFFDLQSVTNHNVIVYMLSYAGHFGVDIFFVISGFLITGLLVPDMERPLNIKRFYGRRFFKIIPLYWCAVLTAVVLNASMPPFNVSYPYWTGFSADGVMEFTTKTTSSHYHGASLLSHIFLWQNYSQLIPTLAHTWSLAIEEHFYLVYPLLLSLIFSLQRQPSLRRRALIITLGGLILLFNLIRFVSYHYFHLTTWYWTHLRADALLFGCLLKILEPLILDSTQRSRSVFGALLLSTAGFIYFRLITDPFAFDESSLFRWAYLGAGALLTGLLVSPFRIVNGLFDNKIIRSVGRNSYALYLWHYILIFPFSRQASHWGTLNTMIIYVAVTLLVAYLTTATIEKTALQLRDKLIP